MLPQRVADAYAEIPGVEAVALAGSRTTAVSDASSDIDLYFYSRDTSCSWTFSGLPQARYNSTMRFSAFRVGLARSSKPVRITE